MVISYSGSCKLRHVKSGGQATVLCLQMFACQHLLDHIHLGKGSVCFIGQ